MKKDEGLELVREQQRRQQETLGMILPIPRLVERLKKHSVGV
jgi:hypothetical protein